MRLNTKFKSIILFICFWQIHFSCDAQTNKILNLFHSGDSSFYHIEKIDNNEFWAAGKNGIIYTIDSLGNFTALKSPTTNNILNITVRNQFIYLVADKGIIIKYNRTDSKFETHQIKPLKNRCIYDIQIDEVGKIYICGGSSKIAKGQKDFPNGFVAQLDSNLNHYKKLRKSWRKMFWSVSETEQHKIIASAFNGKNSRLIEFSVDSKRGQKIFKIKGLVHHIFSWNGKIYYSGAENLHIKNTGIIGFCGTNSKQMTLEKEGCVWSISPNNENILAISNAGNIIEIDQELNIIKKLNSEIHLPIYELVKIGLNRFLMVGSAQQLILTNFKNIK